MLDLLDQYLAIFMTTTQVPTWIQYYLAIVCVLMVVGVAQSLLRGGFFDFDKNWSFYKAYHSDFTNVIIHILCVWPILWTSFLFLGTSQTLVDIPAWLSAHLPSYCSLDASFFVALLYFVYYILLDFRWTSIAASLCVTACWVSTQYTLSIITSEQMTYFIYAHVAAWVMQFYGHAAHEGKAPALLTNLSQALLMAPYFVFLEVVELLGLVSSKVEKKNE